MPARSDEVVGSIPDGWSMKRIGELCHIFSGGTPSKSNLSYWQGDIPWVSGKDLKSTRLTDSIDHISQDGLAAGSRLAPEGTVFLLVRGMGLAKDLPISLSLRPMAFNQDIKALVPRDGLSGAFLRAAIYQAKDRLLSRLVPSAHGTMTLNLDDVETFKVAVPAETEEAETLGRVLDLVQCAVDKASEQVFNLIETKRVATRTLLKCGLRGEPQRETEIGLLPSSWKQCRLDHVAAVYSSSRLSYSELLAREDNALIADAFDVLGIKVIDMTRCAAEDLLKTAELSRKVRRTEAEIRCIRPGTIVFPKNGAAVGTNKKRRVSEWCVLDPNVMALHAVDGVDQAYLFYWIQSFDLKSIVKSGPVPNFGKGDISGVLVPLPSTLEEQREIATTLDAMDRKIDLHRRRRTLLDDLFKTLLHKLMTGEIRVADLDLSVLALRDAAAA